MKKNVCVLLSVLGIAVLNGTGSTPGWAKSAGAGASAASLGQQQPLEALLDTTARQVEQGDFDQASATLERALRIEPRNAGIWHDLAQIRLHQGQYQQAESLASKSNNLASGNRALQARNWKLMAVARKASGNTAGAEEAEARAAQLR